MVLPPPPSIKKIVLALPVYKGPGTLMQETVVFVGFHCVLGAHCQGSVVLSLDVEKGGTHVWLNLRVHLTVLLLCCVAIHWV